MNRLASKSLRCVATLILCAAPTYSQARGAWKIVSVKITPAAPNMLSDHMCELVFRNTRSAKRYRVVTPTFISSVTQTALLNGTLVLIGRTGYLDEAITVRLEAKPRPVRGIGYGTRLLGERWLVSVEWYPNHIYPPDYPNDVVLVRDLREKRRSRAPESNGDALNQLVRNAGRPVFPSANVEHRTYTNVIEGNNPTIDKVYWKTFFLMQDDRLLFVASRGKDGEFAEQKLMAIPLNSRNGALGPATTTDLSQVYQETGVDKGSFLRVDHLEPAGPKRVRIVFATGAYATSSVTVPLK